METAEQPAAKTGEGEEKQESDHSKSRSSPELLVFGVPVGRLRVIAAVLSVTILSIFVFLLFQPRHVKQKTRQKQPECDTEGCRQLRTFLSSTINQSADPCHDFFRFTCGEKLQKERIILMNDAINSKVQAMVSEASVPERNQNAFQKAVAMYRACVSLYANHSSEATHLLDFMYQLGLDPTRLNISKEPLDSMVQLSLAWGLPALVAINEAAGSRLEYPHQIMFSKVESDWYRERQELEKNETYTSFVENHFRFLLPSKDDSFVEELTENTTSVETNVVNFILDDFEEEKNEEANTPYLIKVEDVPKYLNNVVTPGQWKDMVRLHSDYIYRMNDPLILEPLGAKLIVFMLEQFERADVLSIISWSVLRQMAPYADGSERDRSSNETRDFCYQKVRDVLEAALVSKVIYKIVTPDALREVMYMSYRIRESIKTTVGTSSWLPTAPRKAAWKKAEAIRVIVGFPFNLTRLAALEKFYAEMPNVAIKEASFVRTWLNTSRFLRRVQMRHQDEILFTLGWVNAQYTYATDTVNLAGALLQPVLYYHGAPSGYNYGGIGQIMGHEMMHAFDVIGITANERGMPAKKWPKETTDKYVEQASCLRNIHRTALRSRALALNHKLDSEDLADIMGTRVAFSALQNATGEAGNMKNGVRTANTTFGGVDSFTNFQLFFIGHCAKMCDPKVPPRQRDVSQRYAPNWARCVVPLMNMPEFAESFQCAPGSLMNPDRRCKFW